MTVRAIFGGEAIDATPDQFTFTDVSGINPSTVTTSGTVTVTGLSPNIPISVTASGGTVDAGTSSLSGTFDSSKAITTSATGTFVMAARATSSASYSTAVDVVVTVNGVSDTFTVTTRAADTTPNAFTFTDNTSAEPSTVVSTNLVPTGYDYASWSVTGGQGSTDNSTWETSGTIYAGQTFYIRGTSSASFAGQVNVTATIGGVSDTFLIVTRPLDNSPNSFSFSGVSGANLSTIYTSNTVTVTGLEPNTNFVVSASGGTVDAGTSSLSGTFASSKSINTSASGTFVVAARVTSSGSYSTSTTCTISVGGGSGTYTVTTQAADTTPSAFSFSDVTNASLSTVYTSNTVTVSGMSPNVAVTVSASGGTVDAGTSSLSGTFAASKVVTTSASGTIVVAAKVTSSASYTTAVNCTVTVGGVSDTYTVTTMSLPVGEAVFTGTAGSDYSTTWTCPAGVTSVCAVLVGHGGHLMGGGGALLYKNNIAVTPGTSYSISIGLLAYYSGTTALGYTANAAGSLYDDKQGGIRSGGDGGGNGGTGAYGGGGAGGYSGNGGNGGAAYSVGIAGAGGGGGGGGAYDAFGGGGGGGVGLYGQGANGAAGSTVYLANGGGGGSGGGNGGATAYAGSSKYTKGTGGGYGGGQGYGTAAGNSYGGGVGAVRIIWGPGRSFPSNAT